MWVLKEYGVKESQTKLYTINYLNDPKYCVLSPPICMSKKSEILHVFESTLTIYNPEDDSIRHPVVTYIDRLEAKLYIESLVCPILQNEPTTQH